MPFILVSGFIALLVTILFYRASIRPAVRYPLVISTQGAESNTVATPLRRRSAKKDREGKNSNTNYRPEKKKYNTMWAATFSARTSTTVRNLPIFGYRVSPVFHQRPHHRGGFEEQEARALVSL